MFLIEDNSNQPLPNSVPYVPISPETTFNFWESAASAWQMVVDEETTLSWMYNNQSYFDRDAKVRELVSNGFDLNPYRTLGGDVKYDELSLATNGAIKTDRQLFLERNELLAKRREQNQLVQERGNGFGQFLGATAAYMVAEPVNILAMPLAGAYSTAKSLTVLGAAAKTAVYEGATVGVTESIIQAGAVMPYKEQIGSPYTFSDAASNVAAAMIGTSIFGGAIGGAAKWLENYANAAAGLSLKKQDGSSATLKLSSRLERNEDGTINHTYKTPSNKDADVDDDEVVEVLTGNLSDEQIDSLNTLLAEASELDLKAAQDYDFLDDWSKTSKLLNEEDALLKMLDEEDTEINLQIKEEEENLKNAGKGETIWKYIADNGGLDIKWFAGGDFAGDIESAKKIQRESGRQGKRYALKKNGQIKSSDMFHETLVQRYPYITEEQANDLLEEMAGANSNPDILIPGSDSNIEEIELRIEELNRKLEDNQRLRENPDFSLLKQTLESKDEAFATFDANARPYIEYETTGRPVEMGPPEDILEGQEVDSFIKEQLTESDNYNDLLRAEAEFKNLDPDLLEALQDAGYNPEIDEISNTINSLQGIVDCNKGRT